MVSRKVERCKSPSVSTTVYGFQSDIKYRIVLWPSVPLRIAELFASPLVGSGKTPRGTDSWRSPQLQPYGMMTIQAGSAAPPKLA